MWRYNQDKDTFLVLKSSREREIKKIHSSFAEPLKKKKKEGEDTDEICFIYFTYFGN